MNKAPLPTIPPKTFSEGVSIIIPAYNEEKYIGKVLKCLSLQADQHLIEIIVVDNNSQDRTAEEVQNWKNCFKNFKLICETRQGISQARNRGARESKFEYLLFLDSDIFLPPDFLTKFRKKIRDTPNLICLVLHLPELFNILDFLWVLWMFSFVTLVQKWDPLCCGSFMFVPKNLFEKVGGFNEKIVLGEDVECGWRLTKAGGSYRIFWSPYVFASPRRLRQKGRFGLFLLWARGYFHMHLKGPIYATSHFYYPYGIHLGD